MKPQAALLTIGLALLPAAAFAHPGDHAHMGAGEAAQHLLTQPDHKALLAVIALVAALGASRVVARARK